MRLANKRLLMLIADGVDQLECDQMRQSFESEGAQVFYATNQEYVSIETVNHGKRGRDIVIDLPFEAVGQQAFDGLVIPDGYLAAERFCEDTRASDLVRLFHDRGLPIFASGRSVDLLKQSGVLSNSILVREGTPLTSFITQAIGILSDYPRGIQLYRVTMAA